MSVGPPLDNKITATPPLDDKNDVHGSSTEAISSNDNTKETRSS